MFLLHRAPTDCVQYFTGKAGSVKSYNFGGGQLLQSQIYTNCIRTEKGYCAIQWKESSTTSPDPFGVGASPTTQIESNGCDASAAGAFILIPNLSPDGIQKIPNPVGSQGYQSQQCGSNFGIEGMGTIAQPLVSKCLSMVQRKMFWHLFLARQQPFILGVYSDTTAQPSLTGFNLDYTQVILSQSVGFSLRL